MSVTFADGAVHLRGDCRGEDAEQLLTLLQQNISAAIEVRDCGHLHMAVMQILLAAGRPIHGSPANPFVREWLLPQLLSQAD